MNAKAVLKSWDLWLAVVLTAASAFAFPHQIQITAVRDFYSLGIAVLSTIFSVFFAALAIIMSSSDDAFIEFLEEETGGYSRIVGTFRFTLIILFLALVWSVFDYVYTYVRLQNGAGYQRYWLVLSFEFLFLYGLFAALTSALDTISYARYRSIFISLRRRDGRTSNTPPGANAVETVKPEPAISGFGTQEGRHTKIFDTASDIRKFEIELFWKRSLFFWGFIAAAFVAVAALKNDQPTLSLLISQFGILCSLAWTLGNRGSKYWQEQWETKIEQVENHVTGPLFRREEREKTEGWWLRGRRYSVSRLTIAVSDSAVLLWFAVYVRQIWICIIYGTPGKLTRWEVLAISAPVVILVALMAIYGHSTPRVRKMLDVR